MDQKHHSQNWLSGSLFYQITKKCLIGDFFSKTFDGFFSLKFLNYVNYQNVENWRLKTERLRCQIVRLERGNFKIHNSGHAQHQILLRTFALVYQGGWIIYPGFLNEFFPREKHFPKFLLLRLLSSVALITIRWLNPSFHFSPRFHFPRDSRQPQLCGKVEMWNGAYYLLESFLIFDRKWSESSMMLAPSNSKLFFFKLNWWLQSKFLIALFHFFDSYQNVVP